MDGLNQVQFRIVEDEHDGRHLVAIRDLSAGELIFSETPTASSPGDTDGVCIVCYRNLHEEVCNKCWWPVCNQVCISSPTHQAECRLLASCMTPGPDYCLPTRHLLPLRCLILRSSNPRLWERLLQLHHHHGMQTYITTTSQDHNVDDLVHFIRFDCGMSSIPEDDIKTVFSILASSIFRMINLGREFPAVYLTASLLTQSCLQNTRCVFKGMDNRMYVYAAVDIKKGEKITHSYLRNLLHTGTLERRKMLREKLIDCFCARCSDPTELSSNVSAIFCQKCQNLCLPRNALDDESDWECRSCDYRFSCDFFNTLMLSLREEDHEVEDFIKRNEKILPKNHYLMTSERTKIFFKFTTQEVGKCLRKIQAGKELLMLTDILEPGLSAHRESILVNLGMSLQILLSHELVRRINMMDSEGLHDSQVYAAFRDAMFCFKEAFKAAQLEEDAEIPQKAPTIMIKENLTTLEEMKADFEQIMLQKN